MAVVFLGIGSNLGRRKENCLKALEILKKKGLTLLASSSIIETEPWGVEDQPPFVNMVVKAETKLSPLQLLKTVKEIEKEMGRRETYRWGPRVIDIDILFYDSQVVDLPELKIPHPYIQDREFVLRPLSEIAPDLVHPILKKPIKVLLDELYR